MSGRKPDFSLKALNKRTSDKFYIGAGWSNSNGSISIVLNDMVVLTQSKDLVLTLFPRNFTPSEEVGVSIEQDTENTK